MKDKIKGETLNISRHTQIMLEILNEHELYFGYAFSIDLKELTEKELRGRAPDDYIRSEYDKAIKAEKIKTILE